MLHVTMLIHPSQTVSMKFNTRRGPENHLQLFGHNMHKKFKPHMI